METEISIPSHAHASHFPRQLPYQLHRIRMYIRETKLNITFMVTKLFHRSRFVIAALIGLSVIVSVINNQNTAPRYFPSRNLSLRYLSLNLGGGNCKWTPPIYDVPDELEFSKVLIAGFPSGDKRLTFVQMEALTGLSARDEWDFKYLGMTNQPFIKANYPHHEGIWGWENVADKVIVVVRNIRRTLVEYHDILWDIGYAKTWEEASKKLDELYSERPPLEDFIAWRDERVLDEIHWYGWFIDYYMEGGLMRDIFTHKITTPEHWYMLMQPTVYSRSEVEYDRIVGPDTVVTPSYDPHCVNDVKYGCKPVEVISAEKLVDHSSGKAESRKLAKVLQNSAGYEDWLLEEEAWECIWEELIIRKRGLKTFIDREGITERDYNFSEEMLSDMIRELDRLIDKYGPDSEYKDTYTAQNLILLISEHRGLIQVELEEVQSGKRKLRKTDFLGPTIRNDPSSPFFEKKIDMVKARARFNHLLAPKSQRSESGFNQNTNGLNKEALHPGKNITTYSIRSLTTK